MFTPYSWITHAGNSVTATFAVPFRYIAREHVRVLVGWNPSTRSFSSELANGVGFTWASGTSITTTVPPATGATITLLRETPINDQLSKWATGSPPTARELTTADLQILYATQENIDRILQARDDLDAAVLTGAGVTLIDNLNSTLTTAALTANQGRVLRLLVEGVQTAAAAAAAAAQGTANAGVANAAAAQSTANTALAASVPPGTVVHIAQSSAPAGWIKANGAPISRATYSALFAAIGTTFGIGDGTTTFNIPDLRGLFIRPIDDGRGVDPGRVFGSYQDMSNISHTHAINDPGHGHAISDPGHAHSLGYQVPVNGGDTDRGSLPSIFSIDTSVVPNTAASGTGISILGSGTGITLSGDGGAEGRPKNLALLAVIKY